MNKCSLIIKLSLISLLCYSCVEDKELKGIKVDLMLEAKNSIEYSLFVDSIKYIELETTDSCLIGSIKDIAIYQNRMFIFDEQQQTIWEFDREGKYINKIFKLGDGPEDYSQISQFEYDSAKNLVVVLSPGKEALLFYTPESEYIKTINLEMRFEDFKICPEGGFVLSNAGSDEPTSGIYYVNDYGQEMECLVKRKSNHLVYTTFDWELCSYGNKICFMAPNFDNTVYQFVDHKLTVEYPFVMRPDLKHDYMKTVSLQHLEDFIRTAYVEGEKWIWATYWSSTNGLRIFVYSKETGEYWIGKTIINDIDDVGIWRKASVTDGNIFVTWSENENSNENPTIGLMYLK